MINKTELFRFMKALQPKSGSLKPVKASRKTLPAKSGMSSGKVRQNQRTNDLLRRYFAQRMTQISAGV